jgi:hypothetical protein
MPMDTVNYNAEAELFPPRPPRRRSFNRGSVGYKRFNSAAEAIHLRWKNSHRSCFSVPISRSMRTDLMAAPSGSFTRAKPIH